eukprot:gnl/TRDRNA2_/TRDRNA2_160793_c0_seq3.p1 gnl/TRDRNA2_/TRDRNA2_160793_c0~~gnl/TRDRNA2_/TRDRNA2_160793_c0_seq3.p1  ORF type:complete len:219 (-),score=28.20 gnl/TRDRNA2_/TRDRNA2_160793_c0_seq3:409-1023(-)
MDPKGARCQEQDANESDPNTEDDEFMTLPSTFVRHVEHLNLLGTFTVPLELHLCSASLARLRQTRLMFEVLKELPRRAYEVNNPAAWVRRAALTKFVSERIQDPIMNITEASYEMIENLNSSGRLSVALDLDRIGHQLGLLSAEQQTGVLARCRKQGPRVNDPNKLVIKACREVRQDLKGIGKGKDKGHGKKAYKGKDEREGKG